MGAGAQVKLLLLSQAQEKESGLEVEQPRQQLLVGMPAGEAAAWFTVL